MLFDLFKGAGVLFVRILEIFHLGWLFQSKKTVLLDLPDIALVQIMSSAGLTSIGRLAACNKEMSSMANPFLTTGKAMKKWHTWFTIRGFSSIGLPTNGVTTMDFQQLVAKLREKQVIFKIKACIELIYSYYLKNAPTEDQIENIASHIKVNVRIFMAAYMIVYFPLTVFASMGDLETPLLEASKQLLESLDYIMAYLKETESFHGIITAPLPKALAVPFHVLAANYLQYFQAWKETDLVGLITRIKATLVELYTTRNGRPVNDPEMAEFGIHINRLRQKLATLAGNDELAQFDTEHAALIAHR